MRIGRLVSDAEEAEDAILEKRRAELRAM